jgi:hypothetical protein
VVIHQILSLNITKLASNNDGVGSTSGAEVLSSVLNINQSMGESSQKAAKRGRRRELPWSSNTIDLMSRAA